MSRILTLTWIIHKTIYCKDELLQYQPCRGLTMILKCLSTPTPILQPQMTATFTLSSFATRFMNYPG